MKLSVFVVTYNQEKYIAQCLDSILMQNVDFEYEIVIGEDCSTDSTALICDEYAKKHANIVVYHHSKNLGLVKNWEFVLNKCRGEYIAMIEGDDYWINPNKLQQQVSWLDSHPDYALTFTNVDIVGNSSYSHEPSFVHLHTGDYSMRDVAETWTILSSTVVFRNQQKIFTYPKWIYFCDTYTFLTIGHSGKMYCLNEKYTAYRRHEDNLSKTDNSDITYKFSIQYREMAKCFPQCKDVLNKKEEAYLSNLIYDKNFPNAWRARLRYMCIHKHLFFSRFLLSTIYSYMLKCYK